MQQVHLLGLDFGTTTCGAVAAAAVVRRNVVTARMELSDLVELFRSPVTLTPYRDGRLDLVELESRLDFWLSTAGVAVERYFGGGALLTGLAAQADNADGLIALVRGRLKDALIASAGDPCLESWLAYLGNCAPLARAHPRQPFLNLDIGGGTTNLALGLGGEVLATGCLFVGARHFQVVPGTYRITKLSRYAAALLEHLGHHRKPGDELTKQEVGDILDYYLSFLHSCVAGQENRSALGGLLIQVPFVAPPGEMPPLALTLSGGVGELVYRHLRGEPWPGTTAFGDLGVDLAQRLAASPFWAEHWQRYQPEAGGRATVFGLLRHSTHVSGSTVFLPHAEDLPLRDLPILGTLSERSPPAHLNELIRLARASPRGGGLRLIVENASNDSIKDIAGRLTQAMQAQDFPPRQSLVLFVAQNLGKVLGNYITAWGTQPWHVMVIDEISCQDAQYAHIGGLRDRVIPVSFFGLR